MNGTVGFLSGFNGEILLPGRSREIPFGLENHSNLLPAEAYFAGMELMSFSDEENDPYVLYDRWGHILYEWPEEYNPSFTELNEVCRRFM